MKKLILYPVFLFILSLNLYAQSKTVWKFDSVFPKDSSMNNGITGIVVDPEGKVWIQSFYNYPHDTIVVASSDENDNLIYRTVRVNALHVFNSDGSEASFSPVIVNRVNGIVIDTLGGTSYAVVGHKNPSIRIRLWFDFPGNGLSLDKDGNIIAAFVDRIFKLNYRTGEGLGPCLQTRIGGTLAKPVQDFYGNLYIRGFAETLNAIKQFDKNGNFEKNAVGFSLGYSHVIEVSGDGLTVYNAALYNSVIEAFTRSSLDSPMTKKDLIKGVACGSMAWDRSAGNLWFSAGSYSYNLNNYPGEKTYWDYNTWYAYNPVSNKINDSLKWVLFGKTGEETMKENPRAIAFSPDGNTAYAGTFPSGAVRKYVKVIDTSASIIVTSPSAGENWVAGSQKTVTWTSSYLAGNVSIKLSADGGTSFPYTIKANIPNSGSMQITVPANISTTCRIKVESVNDASVFGVNPGNFYITGLKTLKLIRPQGGEVWTAGQSCSIGYTSNYISKINIDLSTDDGSSWSTLRKDLPVFAGGANVDLYAPSNILSAKCRVKIVCAEDSSVYDVSDSVFTIQPETYVELLAPKGGENYKTGEKQDIIWAFKNVSNIKLEFSSDNGNSWNEIASVVPALQLKYSWTVPDTPSRKCLIKISDVSNRSISDCSSTFNLLSPPVISLSKKMLNFGSVLPGKSIMDSILIGNNGEIELSVTGVSSGNNFFTANVNSFIVAPGKTQTLFIRFKPDNPSDFSGRLVISHNCKTSSDTVSLSGSGLNYPQQISLNQSHAFGPVATLSSYRMIGFPGSINIPASELLKGNYPVDWNMFDDNGAASSYQIGYDGSSKFNFIPGKAFWVLSKEPVSIIKTVDNVKLDTTDNSYSIPLHSGWNLISNPFNKAVSWHDVILLNKLDNNNIIYKWNGQWLYPDSFEPYSGYYFNNLRGIPALKIPFVSTSALNKKNNLSALSCTGDSSITVFLYQGGEVKSEAAVTFNYRASNGFDSNDYLAAPGDFDPLKVFIYEPDINMEYKCLMTECISTVGEGKRFEFRMKNTSGSPAVLKISRNIELKDFRIYLLDKGLQKFHDLTGRNSFELISSKKESVFDLLIGTDKFIEQSKAAHKIDEFCLFQNYPNPFNPGTSIRFALAEESKVRVVIYNSIGREVKTFDKSYLSAGYHEIDWSASGLSSGIYICCLEAVSEVTGRIYTYVNKMLLLK